MKSAIQERMEMERRSRKAHRRPINRYLLIRAMKAIEGLTYEDIGGTDREKLDDIYCMAHAALNHCNNNHDGWKKKIITMHKAMVHFGVAEP